MNGLFCGLSRHLNNGMGFGAEGCQQSPVHRAGVNHHDLSAMFNRWPGCMADHNRAVTAVIALPK